MHQQQFKIRMSVSTKLLLAISFLLATPIFFLNYSAINLFRNDKKAYIYDSQTTASVLTGREFVSFLQSSLGTLKLLLGTTDFQRQLTQENKNAFKFYLENQQSILGTQIFSTDQNFQPVALLYEQFLPTSLEDLKTSEDAIKLDSAALHEILVSKTDVLRETGFAFVNLTSADKPPVLAVILADTHRAESKNTITVAIGFAPLQHFLGSSSNSFNSFAIVTKDGRLLFHSDRKQLAQLKSFDSPLVAEANNSVAITGAKEFSDASGTRTLGTYYKPGLDLVAVSQIEYVKAMKATYTLTERFVTLALAALGLMIILALIFSKRLTSPIDKLFKATNEVSKGNFNVVIPVSSRDEIGALTNSFVAMSSKISDLIKQMVDKVRVDQELEIARTVQQSLFPPTTIPGSELLVESHYESASECGGDWWGYFQAQGKHVVVIADATGHGLPSALMTASARGCFSVIEKLVTDEQISIDPAEMLSVANRVVYEAAQGKIMMTCFICVIDVNTHTARFANAGHNPPWVFSRTENGTTKMSSLVARGERLGERRDFANPTEAKETTISPGDILFFYTDGLLEGKNTAGEQYGKKKARQVIEDAISQTQSNAAAAPAKIIEMLITDFREHNIGKAYDDDVTLAVIQVKS